VYECDGDAEHREQMDVVDRTCAYVSGKIPERVTATYRLEDRHTMLDFHQRDSPVMLLCCMILRQQI
jgi:3-hydroxymyristoyl/3-hydroxydecanoyl-(acyl carrier protein) dehydratase